MNNQPNQNQNNQPKPAIVVNGDQNKNFMKIAAIVVILVIIAALVGNGKWKANNGSQESSNEISSSENLPDGCKPGYLFSETTGKPCPAISQSTSASAIEATTPSTTVSTSSSYASALKTYAGKTIMFDASCKANPAEMTVDAGTRVLVANNSNKTLALALGSKSASLRPYHYFTHTLKEAGEVKALCNGTSTATVTVK